MCLPRYDFPLSAVVWVSSVRCILIFTRAALIDSLSPMFIYVCGSFFSPRGFSHEAQSILMGSLFY